MDVYQELCAYRDEFTRLHGKEGPLMIDWEELKPGDEQLRYVYDGLVHCVVVCRDGRLYDIQDVDPEAPIPEDRFMDKFSYTSGKEMAKVNWERLELPE